MNNWRLLNPTEFPNEAPEIGQTIFVTFVRDKEDAPCSAISPWLGTYDPSKLNDFISATNASGFLAFWKPIIIPVAPKNPKIYKPYICTCKDVCEDGFDDNGYCLKTGKCPYKAVHPELGESD